MLNITVTFPDGSRKPFPYGTRVENILEEKVITWDHSMPIVAVLFNNELLDLSARLLVNGTISPVSMDNSQGSRVYRRSLCFLIGLISKQIFKEKKLIIGHSLGDGFYYSLNDGSEITDQDINLLNEEFAQCVSKEIPIKRMEISYIEAVNYFKNQNSEASSALLKYRNDSRIPIHTCLDYLDIAHEPLVNNTSILKYYRFERYGAGVILRFPRTGNYGPIADDFEDNPVLFNVYQEYKDWGKILNVESIGQLNEKIHQKNINHFIRVAETLHNKKIASIADRIHENRKDIRAVLIAGPSSSGKTTFTKKLAIQLQVLGFNPLQISLDNYYLPADQVPVDEGGEKDFEALEALDIDTFNNNLIDLIEGKEAEIPIFDFNLQGRRKEGLRLKMDDRSILLIEGIHGLNEKLSYKINKKNKFKIFVSALTQLNLDELNRIPTTDNRLIRRIVRDFQYRQSSALKTLQMWPSVRRGEKKNIFPFQNSADVAFNSALDYELAVLKTYADPLLRSVKPSDPEYQEAIRLLNFLQNFSPLPANEVPGDSILREFIGYSNFKYN